MMRICAFLVVFGLSIGTVLGQSSAPKYSNEFLAIGISARALGMSNAVAASTNDVTAGYWNPAGLLNLDNNLQVGLMHAEYFGGIAKFDYAGVAKRIDTSSVLGFSVIRFGVDNIPNTTELIDNEGNINYDRITEFSAADYAFLFSYARKLPVPGLRVGANFKVIYRHVGDFANAWGFGLDASMIYERNGWHFAAMARDVTSTVNAWSYGLDDRTKEVFLQTGNELPQNSLEITLPRLILAAGKRFPIGEKFSIHPEVNMSMTFDGKRNVLIPADPISFDPYMGLEAGFKDMIFIRSGIGTIQRVQDIDGRESLTLQPSVGAGVRIKRVQIDYALTNINSDLALFSNVFSLRFDITTPQKSQ